MTLRRVNIGLTCFACTVIGACEKAEIPPKADSPTSLESTAAVPSRSWTGTWVDGFGAMVVVPSDSENSAVVVFPDSPSARLIASSPLTLVNAAGDTVAARVVAQNADSVQCGDAPMVRLGSAVSSGWTVGLQSGALAPLRMDSIEALPAADSARLVANLARLASSLAAPNNSRFNGLPFSVLTARRFDANNRRILVAHVMRRLPQEASPLEEHTFIIAERPRSADSSFVLAYSQRSEGSEETAEHFEVLAVIGANSATVLLLARDQVSRTEYQLLERSGAGVWRLRWSRPLSC